MWRTYDLNTCPLHMSCIVHPGLGQLSQVREHTTESPHPASGKCELLPTHRLLTCTFSFLVQDLDLELSPGILLRTWMRVSYLQYIFMYVLKVFHQLHLFVSVVDPRLLETSGQCFSSLLRYFSTW